MTLHPMKICSSGTKVSFLVYSISVGYLSESVHVYYMELGEPVWKQESAQRLRFGSSGCSIIPHLKAQASRAFK